MKQILNIITKDVRHHWFEVAASMALMVAFAWIEIHGWTHQDAMAVGFSGFFVYRILLQLVVVLVPLSWMFLIVRVVHGEALVGDRQFWVTRPYDWKKLVVAKALFVLAFINLPLFVLDVFLLAKGGFRPSSHVPGLFWMQLLLILALFLPTAALAVITAGLGQMLLALLIVALYMIGMAALSNLVPNSDYSGGNDSWLGIVLIGTALAIILLQYSTRKTARSRWLIVGLAAALTLLLIATPYRSLMARDYPLPDTSSLKFALLPGHPPDPGDIAYDRDTVPIHLPLELTGLANDSFLQMNGFIITVTNSRGERWDSGWHVRSMLLFSDQKSHSLDFDLKRTVFDRMKSSPVKLQLLLAFTLFHDENQRLFVVPGREFFLPELGFCSTTSAYWQKIDCRVPLRHPRFLLISTDTAASTCPITDDQTPPRPGELARGSIQNSDSSPAEIGISPIKTVEFYFSNWSSDAKIVNRGICAGTPLVLSQPEAVSRNRVELYFDDLSLVNYQQGSGLGKIVIKRSP